MTETSGATFKRKESTKLIVLKFKLDPWEEYNNCEIVVVSLIVI